jgi:hypothetical protein
MKNKVAILAALFACLLGVWIYSEKKGARAVRPPEGSTNLVAFLEARPPSQIRKFIHEGNAYIEVIGKPVTSLLSLPSGPPAYIFNENGALVDWSRDIGDDPSFVSRWGGFSNATSISIEEAKQLVKAREP